MVSKFSAYTILKSQIETFGTVISEIIRFEILYFSFTT